MDKEIVIPLTFGLTVNENPLTTEGMSCSELVNLAPQRQRLFVEPRKEAYASAKTTDLVDNFIKINNTLLQYGLVGFKIGKAIYTFDQNVTESNVSQDSFIIPLVKIDDIYSTTEKTELYTDYFLDDTMQSAEWNYLTASVCYFTRLGLPLYKTVEASEKQKAVSLPFGIEPVKPTFVPEGSELPVYLSAKYIVTTKDRLFLANVLEGSTYYPTRLQWSNLNQPEDFSTGLNKEADYTYLGVNAREITGLAYVKDTVVTFCRNCIYTSEYEGHENSFRTSLLTTNTGCLYHYSAITVNDVVFFIGRDNFYVLDQFTPVKIGDPIWGWFNDNILDRWTDNVIAQYEVEQHAVSWIFTRKSTNKSIALKFFINEKLWSTRTF